MANNATTTWRWAGTTDTDWQCNGGPNWLDADGVSIDDYPIGPLPTNTIYFHGSENANSCANGPGAALTIGTWTFDDGYNSGGNFAGDGNITVTNLNIGTIVSVELSTGTITNTIMDAGGGGYVAFLAANFGSTMVISASATWNLYGLWTCTATAGLIVDVFGTAASYVQIWDGNSFADSIWNIWGFSDMSGAAAGNISDGATFNVYGTLQWDTFNMTLNFANTINLMRREAIYSEELTAGTFIQSTYDHTPRAIIGG